MEEFERSLRSAIRAMDINDLEKIFNESTTDSVSDKRTVVDFCLKAEAISTLRQTKNWSEDIPALLDFCFEAAAREFAAKTILVSTLTDIFESTTIDKCEKLFEYVEVKTPRWKEAGFIEACRTQLLRMCNDLLRRLSRTIDTEFCGRILIFLARCLPLTEKSGLNLTSQFNVDNVTKYDPIEQQEVSGGDGSAGGGGALHPSPAQKVVSSQHQQQQHSESMEVEEGETDVAGTPPVSVDYNLYVKFWQLQSFFASPNNCYEKFGWRQFQHNAIEILNALDLLKLDPPSSSTSLSEPERKRARDEEKGSGDKKEETLSQLRTRRPTWLTMNVSEPQQQQRSTYFAKYLTSQKLLHLQFNDSTFRRYILVQFLVMFQYLNSDVKFKDKKVHILSEENTKWLEENTKKCYELLAETYPRGEYFVKVVQRILNREENWNQWKNNGCEDFTQRADKEKMLMFKKRQKQRAEDKKFDLGNPTLTALWNVAPDNFEACRTTERKFVPEIELFFDEAIEQLDPEAGIEENYKLVNDENFQWRALRLLCMKSSHFVQPTAQQVTSIGSFLSGTCEKLAEDIPKFKDLKTKSSKQSGGGEAAKIGGTNSQDANLLTQQESEIVRTDMNAEEEAEFRAQNNLLEGPGEQIVSQDQIDNLSALIGSDWTKLAQELDMSEASVAALRKKQVPGQACGVVLSQWCELEGAMATVKRLRNILLKAELFNEDVSAILSTTNTTASASSGSSGSSQAAAVAAKPYIGGRVVVAPLTTSAAPGGDQDQEKEEEKAAEEETQVEKPAPVSAASLSSSSRKRSSAAATHKDTRAATPVMDERQSTASN